MAEGLGFGSILYKYCFYIIWFIKNNNALYIVSFFNLVIINFQYSLIIKIYQCSIIEHPDYIQILLVIIHW